jgi:hypothetical protein
MRHLASLICAIPVSVGCSGTPAAPGEGTPDAGTVVRACALPETTPATGTLTATKAQRCNVPGSMGRAHWYRLSAVLPGTMSYVQLELWDGIGAFAGGVVRLGTFQIAGAEAAAGTCGVCVRGLGDKGGAAQKEYFATGGSVTITALGAAGAPITATLSNVTFGEVDASRKPVAGGCAATVATATVTGTLVQVGGGGGGASYFCSQ